MYKKIIVFLILATFFMPVISTGVAQAQGTDNQTALKELLNRLDTSITSFRKGDIDEAKGLIADAYSNYNENFKSDVQAKDSALHDKIDNSFTSLNQTPIEADIFALKSDVSRAASLIGVSLSPIYAYSMFIIIGVAAVVSLLITLLTKRLVNWDKVRERKAKVSEFMKEYRDATSKRDMKRLHKLQPRQAEIRTLQGQVFSATLKPTIIYMIPLMLIWFLLTGAYSGWVVAWAPFSIDLPIFGRLVAFGVGWWYFLTYLGFSQIFRKILIRD